MRPIGAARAISELVQKQIQEPAFVDVGKFVEVLDFRIEIHFATRCALGREEIDGLGRGDRLDVLRLKAEQFYPKHDLALQLRIAQLA